MIVQSLWVFLYGMAGIFVVMLIIVAFLTLLNKLTRGEKKDGPGEQ